MYEKPITAPHHRPAPRCKAVGVHGSDSTAPNSPSSLREHEIWRFGCTVFSVLETTKKVRVFTVTFPLTFLVFGLSIFGSGKDGPSSHCELRLLFSFSTKLKRLTGLHPDL